MCGQNVARRPELARAVADAGHEIGNHSDGHPYLPLCSAARVRRELVAAQRRIEEHTGRTARFFRPPFGLRAPALPAVLAELGLTCVMWTVIGNDWKLPADAIAERVLSRVGDGGIICLHDGDRARAGARRDATVEATRRIVPALLERGYAFVGLERMAGTP
jgi:peptidoglycan/xylan/chitin deacetylase (PgdA/CDA1 family)